MPPDQGDEPDTSHLKPGAPAIVSVCVTCRMDGSDEVPRIGTLMSEALLEIMPPRSSPGAIVRGVQCLGVCRRPATVAVSAPQGYTFVFGDLDPQVGAAAIATFVRLYRDADYGFVPWAQRPELLRSRLVARVPATTWSPPDGNPPA